MQTSTILSRAARKNATSNDSWLPSEKNTKTAKIGRFPSFAAPASPAPAPPPAVGLNRRPSRSIPRFHSSRQTIFQSQHRDIRLRHLYERGRSRNEHACYSSIENFFKLPPNFHILYQLLQSTSHFSKSIFNFFETRECIYISIFFTIRTVLNADTTF